MSSTMHTVVPTQIRLYWPAEAQWYACRVVKRDSRAAEHLLQYDDGSHEWTHLPNWRYEPLLDSTSSSASSSSSLRQHSSAPAVTAAAAATATPIAARAATQLKPPNPKDALCARWPERKAQSALLAAAFTSRPALASVAISGASATGKTLVTRGVLEQLRATHAYVDCRWSSNAAQLQRSVFDALSALSVRSGVAARSAKNLTAAIDFVESVGNLEFVRSEGDGRSCGGPAAAAPAAPIVLVLDHAEKLIDVSPSTARGSVLSTMLRLQELCGQRRLCVVTISEAPLALLARHGRGGAEHVAADVALQPALRVRFSPYSTRELGAVLRRTTQSVGSIARPAGGTADGAAGLNAALHAYVCAYVFKIFRRDCAGFDELRALQSHVLSLYTHAQSWFVEAQRRAARGGEGGGEGGGHGGGALRWAELDAALRPYARLLLRDPTRDVGGVVGGGGAAGGAAAQRARNAVAAAEASTVLHELPQRSKMLIVSAFLCSHNPAEQDVRVFSPEGMRGGRRKRRKKGGQSVRAKPIGRGGVLSAEARRRADIAEAQKCVSAVKQRFVGPQPFPWERLLAVLHSAEAIQHGTASARSSSAPVLPLWNEVNRLVHLQLLQRLPPRADCTAVRLRCTVGYATVSRIAASMRPKFPLNELLVGED